VRAGRIQIQGGVDGLVPCDSTGPLMALGAKGVVATVSNVMPRETHELAAAALTGDYARARELHYKLPPLVRALFVETNPIPVKQALAFMGKCTAEMRMPLVQMSPGPAEKLHAVMKELRLI
jgi:4-hydroxy-tetrahydrodipicolinate synthase